ncbi:MAG: 30S ribosome-binding factor RbfA [Eubacteriales bacterium]|nr:30S ribosome-binding factor RbfA [Eubacteriales bacterium]MDD4474562.1 30S ribosome-binding factor RbfA [Eubacteriales bacterium]
MGRRQEKIDEITQRELNEIIRSVKDHRLAGYLVNITASRVSRDLSVARVYFAALPAGGGNVSDDEVKKITQGLDSASPYIRSELAQRLNLRQTPKLMFEYDRSVENAMKIEKTLKELGKSSNES